MLVFNSSTAFINLGELSFASEFTTKTMECNSLIGPLFSFQHLCLFNPFAIIFQDGKAILLEGNILFVKQDDKMIAKTIVLNSREEIFQAFKKILSNYIYNYIILSNLFT